MPVEGFVGLSVGEFVGLRVGEFVGFATGLAIGLLEGLETGFLVGLEVGFLMGLAFMAFLVRLAVALTVGLELQELKHRSGTFETDERVSFWTCSHLLINQTPNESPTLTVQTFSLRPCP